VQDAEAMTKASRVLIAAVAALLGTAIASDAFAAGSGRSGGRGGGHPGSRGGAHPGGHAAHPGVHRYPGGSYFVPRYRAGVFIGAPLFAPFYYYPPPPPYYYPAPIMAPTEPIYIEQYPGQTGPDPASYWYFCASANAYYPYVGECPEGWQPVSPQPSS
jgi:hypothetical protein